jgi:hypothetical protein
MAGANKQAMGDIIVGGTQAPAGVCGYKQFSSLMVHRDHDANTKGGLALRSLRSGGNNIARPAVFRIWAAR